MGNEMASGEPSYGMAIMSGRRSGKMQGRCEELATERDNILDRYNHSVSENTNLRSRCEKLNAMCIELATDYAKAEAERDEMQLQMWAAQYCVEEVEKERDEARQWARKLLAINAPLARQARDARKWASIKCDDNSNLRAQLAEARNKALDEADKAAYHAMNERWGELIGIGETLHVRTAILALKAAS